MELADNPPASPPHSPQSSSPPPRSSSSSSSPFGRDVHRIAFPDHIANAEGPRPTTVEKKQPSPLQGSARESVLAPLSQLLDLPAPSSVPVAHMQRLWWSKDTVAVVTGGNRGLGLTLVRELAMKGLTVVLTARDSRKGLQAYYSLRADGVSSIAFHPLDVCSETSVAVFAAWLRNQFQGLDILINNAGLHCYSESHEDAIETFETNYYGVKRVTAALIPLMRASRSGARIINVSSQAATQEQFKTSRLKDKLSNLDILTDSKMDEIVSEYLDDLKEPEGTQAVDDDLGERPINNFQFMESKLALNAYTQALARSLLVQQPHHHQIFVNAICPGAIQTDMAAFLVRKATEVGHDVLHDVFGGCAIQSFDAAAKTALWIALLPRVDYPNGRFFADENEISF